MTFWLILAGMTAGALASIALPFAKRVRAGRTGDDVAVYRDQLTEIDRDRAAGQIGDSEAEAARIEVSRRLLNAVHAEQTAAAAPAPAASGRARRAAVLALSLIAAPLMAAGLYYRLGAPEEARPRPVAQASAKDPGGLSLAEMVRRVEAHIQADPRDGRGYEVLAPIYMRLERFDDAVEAWRRAIALMGDDPTREAGLGEALVGAADGVVTDAAKAAFDKALARDAASVPARYYMGVAALQDGRRADARKIWADLLASAGPDADWAAPVRRALAELDGKPAANQTAANAQPGPGASDVEAAQMTKDQRTQMIETMVARLADKLKADGDDPEGWARLVKSYGVLGQADRQQAALAQARKALGGEADKLRRFEDDVKGL